MANIVKNCAIYTHKSSEEGLEQDFNSLDAQREACAAYIASHQKGWRNPKHIAQWRTTIETYANPLIGKLHVRDVILDHVLKILEPIWAEKTETANRLSGRIEVILDWAKTRGLRSGDNPVRWKGCLDTILPARSKIAKVKHHRACDLRDVADFMKELRQIDTIGARALEFLILTNVRSRNSREAAWKEIDLEHAIWTIPANLMEGEKEHRVPLSESAVKLLKGLTRNGGRGAAVPE